MALPLNRYKELVLSAAAAQTRNADTFKSLAADVY
jgi:hypothetical protein